MWTTWVNRLYRAEAAIRQSLYRAEATIKQRLFRAQRAPEAHTELTGEQRQILSALVQGAHLKSHRTADGDKTYCLHNGDGTILAQVSPASVEGLREAGLVIGNMKFPAATYLLTQNGLHIATAHSSTSRPLHPLTPR